MKKYNRSYAKKHTKRQLKIRKYLGGLLLLAIAFTAYAGWLMEFPEYAIAEVSILKPTDYSTMNLEERLFNDLDAYGFTLHEKLNTIRLVGDCENRNWDVEDNYDNKPTKGCPNGSTDRGLFMLNDCYHKEVSNSCAYNYECSLKEFVRIYRERGWKEWSCGKSLGLK